MTHYSIIMLYFTDIQNTNTNKLQTNKKGISLDLRMNELIAKVSQQYFKCNKILASFYLHLQQH